MDGLKLTNLPEDVLLDVALFLGYNELVALSASCKFLRSALNVDCVWKRVASGDSSVLEKWKELSESSGNGLDPLPSLCHQRRLCLRRAQMVNSIRERRFYKQTALFTGCLYALETSQILNNKVCTYDGRYLFSIDYENLFSQIETVKITELGESKVTTENSGLILRSQSDNYNVIVSCEVTGDKLVVRQDNLIKIYQINIDPKNLSLLHTINTCHGFSNCILHIVGNAIFSENDLTKIIHVWDVHSGQSFGDLVSSKEGFYLTVIGHSKEYHSVLFYSESRERAEADILQYCTKLMGFTEFSVKIDKQNVLNIPTIIGLLNEKYNIVIIRRIAGGNRSVTVHVYDRLFSVLVCEKNFEKIDYIDCKDDFFCVKDCLALRTLIGIKIVHVRNLEILWEIFNKDQLLLNSQVCSHARSCQCRYLNVANALHLLVVTTFNYEKISIWDFELRRKLFELPPYCTDICVNDTFTKLIFRSCEEGRLAVWSFGKV